MSKAQAEKFYEVHKERPFFGELVEFMMSAPVVVQVLEGENAVARYREVMGATNPAQAAEGTIRKLYAESVGENSVHVSKTQNLKWYSSSPRPISSADLTQPSRRPDVYSGAGTPQPNKR
jgi:nucleoside diphosphate kinase